ncbi:hypothetical protein JD969_01280 [Planctomycetota bacterium]|nr:hypothetical protein JD969_01280 [Planctomycetota bacterium]
MKYTWTTLFALLFILIAGCSTTQNTGWTETQKTESQNARDIGIAYVIYTQENQGKMPQKLSDIKPYLSKPIELNNYKLFTQSDIKNINHVDSTETLKILQTKNTFDGKHIVVLADGHVELTE